MSRIKKDFLNIQGWMLEELGLSGKELMAYAIIYRFSYESENGCYASLGYFQKWLGVSKRETVINILDELVEKGLVTKQERPGYTNVYWVNEELLNEDRVSENRTGVSENRTGGSPKIGHPESEITDEGCPKIGHDIYNRLDITENKQEVNLDNSSSSSFEATETKHTDEVNEQDTTQQPSTESKVPRNQASVIYNTLRSRLGRAARNRNLPQDVRDRASKQLLMLKNSATNHRIKQNLQNMIELSDADIVKQAVFDSLNAVYTDRDGSPQNTNVVRLLSMEDYQMALSIMQGNIKDPTALIEKIGDDIEEE